MELLDFYSVNVIDSAGDKTRVKVNDSRRAEWRD